MQLTLSKILRESGGGARSMGSHVPCREGVASLRRNRLEMLRLNTDQCAPRTHCTLFAGQMGKELLLSVHREVRGLFLIRVKLNIFIFYPSTSSIWDPSRASEGKVMVQDSAFCGAHGCRGQESC